MCQPAIHVCSSRNPLTSIMPKIHWHHFLATWLPLGTYANHFLFSSQVGYNHVTGFPLSFSSPVFVSLCQAILLKLGYFQICLVSHFINSLWHFYRWLISSSLCRFLLISLSVSKLMSIFLEALYITSTYSLNSWENQLCPMDFWRQFI